MCKRSCNQSCLGTVPIFSPPQRNTSHSVLWSWHTLYWWGLRTIFLPNVHYTGTSLSLATAELGKYWAATSHDEKCPLHAMWGQKLWIDRRPRISHLIHECFNQQCYRCISTLHHHWSLPQYRSAQTTQQGDCKQRSRSLWHANKCSLKASPSPRHLS